jgi:hypothetical protein
MTKILLEELKAACQAEPRAADADRVAEGETVWLAGRPVAAESGLIGLSLGDGQATIVSESAVREVVKEDPYYFVRVPVGTTVLVRSEALSTLRDDAGGCGCGGRCQDHSSTGAARQAPGGGGSGTGPIIIQCPLACRVENVCSYYIGGTGRLMRICVPILSCRRECPSQPA